MTEIAHGVESIKCTVCRLVKSSWNPACEEYGKTSKSAETLQSPSLPNALNLLLHQTNVALLTKLLLKSLCEKSFLKVAGANGWNKWIR